MFQFFEEFVMKMKILLLLLLLLAPANKLLMQEIPDCMCPPLKHPPSGYLVNQDSAIVIDTCGIWYPSISCDSAYWGNVFSKYGLEAIKRIYAKNTWLIWFDVKAIPLPEAPSDSVIEVTWRDIDSLNYPEIKDSLKSIEQIYGTYKLIKVNPQFTEPDIGQSFDVIFENYVNVNELTKKFRDCPFAHCDFLNWLSDDYPDDVKDNHNDSLIIYPNPAFYFLYIKSNNDLIDNINIISTLGCQQPLNINKQYDKIVVVNVSRLPSGVYFIVLNSKIYEFIKGE
jgi:hypothetical protein